MNAPAPCEASAEEAAESRVVVGVMGLSRGSSPAASFASHAGVEVRYLCDADSTLATGIAESFAKKTGQTPKVVGISARSSMTRTP